QGAHSTMANLPVDFGARQGAPAGTKSAPARPAASLQNEVQRVLVDRYAPPGVIVDEELKILQFLGHTGRYLEPPPGDASLTLPRMVRDGMLHGLRNAFHQARRDQRAARRAGLHVRHNGDEIDVAIEVIPLTAGPEKNPHYLVLFQEADGAPKAA